MNRLAAGLVVALDLIFLAVYIYLATVRGELIGERINSLAFSLFPLVGAILLRRHPRNPVGYLVSILGLAVLGAGALFEYSLQSLNEQTAGFPLTGEAAWISMILWTTVLPCLVMILLLFPDGRLPGRRWRLVAYLNFLITLPVILFTIVAAWRNRAVIAAMEMGLVPRNPELANLNRAHDIWNLAIIGLIILALVSFIFRFSRARGIERQQLKWFVFGLSTVPASMLLDELLMLVDIPLLQGFNWVLNIVSITAFPVVMLIAITRYRLYDIDIIIRRTLLYSALTLSLALIYFSTVLLTQEFFNRRFGEQPAVMIVLSTLLIAALFQPLRRRFQTIIDQRFYRSKYNAEQTLSRFAAHLRNEVDLDEIQRVFIAIVDENIQPEQAELWLVKK